MGIVFTTKGGEREVGDAGAVEAFVEELLGGREVTFFVRRGDDELHVVCVGQAAIVIHVHHGETYVARDGSLTPGWSTRKKVLVINGDRTEFRENIVLTRGDVREVVRHFCGAGGMLPRLFWLREGAERRGP